MHTIQPFYNTYTLLAAGFLAGGSRQEKASVRLPCFGKKLAANAKALLSVAEIEKQKLNYAEKFI